MARVQVEVTERIGPFKPNPDGVAVNVVAIELITPEDQSKKPYVKVTVKQIPGEDGISGQNTFLLGDPAANEQYVSQNIAKYLMLFGSLSDTKSIKEAEQALGGYENEFSLFVESMMGYLAPNWQTIPCNIFMCYPIKDGVVAKNLGLPTVGNYINSSKRPEPLTIFNPQYHSMEPGAGDEKPEIRTVKALGQAPKKF